MGAALTQPIIESLLLGRTLLSSRKLACPQAHDRERLYMSLLPVSGRRMGLTLEPQVTDLRLTEWSCSTFLEVETYPRSLVRGNHTGWEFSLRE